MAQFELTFDITNRTVIEADTAEEAEAKLKAQFAASDINVTGGVDIWDDWGQPNVHTSTEVTVRDAPTGDTNSSVTINDKDT